MKSDAGYRVECLDGLRGLAALVVVFGHYFGAFYPFLDRAYPFFHSVAPLAMLFFNGTFAVSIFFVLSGFVLAESSAKTKSNFFVVSIARYFRLTGPMLTALVLAWVLTVLFRESRIHLQQIARNDWLTAAFYTDQRPSFLTAVRDGIYGVYKTGYSLFDGPTWTMRKELLGSLAVYLLYLAVPSRYRWWSLGIFALVTAWKAHWYLGFPIGIFLREASVRGWIRTNRLGWVLLTLGLIYAGLFNLSGVFRPNLLAVAGGSVVFAVMTVPSLRTVLDSAVPQFLGRISFFLYLLHWPLLLSLVAWSYLHFGAFTPLAFAANLVGYLTIAIILAFCLTIWIDEPLIQALHRLKRKAGYKANAAADDQ